MTRYFELQLRPIHGLGALVAVASAVLALPAVGRASPVALGPASLLLALGSAAALTGLGWLRDETPSRARRSYWATGLHFVATNALALAWAVNRHGAYLEAGEASAAALGMASRDFFLVAGGVGGLLALARSTRTNSSALEMAARLERMEQGAATSDALLRMALDAHDASTQEQWEEAVKTLVVEANPPGGALSLWLRTPDGWRIVAQDGLGPRTQGEFGQPVLRSETRHGGVVANMDVTVTWSFHERDPSAHRWYRTNPLSRGTERALAATLVADSRGFVVGAVCLTYDPLDDGSPSNREVARTLLIWRAVFTLVMERLVSREGHR